MVEKINLPLLLLIILLFSLVHVGAYTPSNLFNYQETSILLNKENIQSKFFLSSLPSFSNGNKNISNQFNPLNDERALEINKIIEDNKKDRVNKSFYSKKPVIVILHLNCWFLVHKCMSGTRFINHLHHTQQQWKIILN